MNEIQKNKSLFLNKTIKELGKLKKISKIKFEAAKSIKYIFLPVFCNNMQNTDRPILLKTAIYLTCL